MNFICGAIAFMGMDMCETPVSMEVHQNFVEHVAEFGLSYGTQEEYNYRLSLFAKKDAEIK